MSPNLGCIVIVSLMGRCGLQEIVPVSQASETYIAQGRGEAADDKRALEMALGDALAKVMEDFVGDYNPGQEQFWLSRILLAHPKYALGKDGYTILAQQSAEASPVRGTATCEVRVHVPRSRLDDRWNESKRFFDDLGGLSPTVSLFFLDRIEENDPWWSRETERNPESWVGQQIDELLTEQQFEVVVNSQTEILRHVHGDFSKLSQQDMEVLREIASKQGAHIFVVGYSHCIGPDADPRVIPGTTVHKWITNAKAKMYWTDNGVQIATLDSQGKGGETDQSAGRITSLRNAGSILAPKFLAEVYDKWGVCAFEGRTLTVTVLNATFPQAQKIKGRLESVLGSKIRSQPANGVVELSFKHKGPSDELAGLLLSEPFEGFGLEVMEARYNTIRLTLLN